MASLRKSPRSNSLPARVQAVIKQHVSTGDRVVIGLSGGVDSVVLLDVLHRLSRNLSFALAAVHVNHQLQRSAGEWARFCRAVCRTLKVPLKVVKVAVAPVASVEAAARTARYRAWRNVRTDFIALAHNMDDQAETVLLQLLRGSGVKGLSAMPLVRALDAQSSAADVASQWASPSGPSVRSGRSAVMLRPLLEVPRSEIEAYARRRKLKWIEDDSNANIAFDRNFVRLEVLPVIARRYPAYRTTLLRASQHAAEAARLLDERSDCTVIDANGQHLWCIGATLLDLAIDAAGTATARIEAINVGSGEEAGVLAALAHRQAARVRIRRDPGAAAVTLEVSTTPPPCTLAGWDPVLHRVLREGLPVAATSWWTLHELSNRALSPDTIDSRRHAGPIIVAADGRIIGRPVDDDTDFALLGRTTA